MKRLIFTSVVLLALGALTFWGNRLLGRALDAQLGPLLSRQLGLPVQLSPIKAQLLKLQASSPKLILGDPQNPAVVATDVELTLVLADLLHGEIRFKDVSAADLMVQPSRWPRSGAPLPTDVHFLDPWLPERLQLESGRYVSEDGDSYPVSKLDWQRLASGGARASWSETRAPGELALAATLKSLPDLLQLAPIELELTVTVAGKRDSAIALNTTVQPGTKSAYALDIAVQASGMTAHVAATGQTAWQLPEESETTIPLLDITSLLALVDNYREPGASDDLATLLASTLPRLQLPTHRSHVAIAEIRREDEIHEENVFDVTSGKTGLQISALTSKGPRGMLSGAMGIVSDDQGWVVTADADVQAREEISNIAAQSLESDWQWHTGRAKLSGKGTTWGTLLNSLRGELSLAGHYRSEKPIPVTIDARLDSLTGEFALDSMVIRLGEAHLSGSARLSGSGHRTLNIDLTGTHLDLDFLFDEDVARKLPGMALPEYLDAVPKLDLYMTLGLDSLQTPALSLGKVQGTLERTVQGGKVVLTAKGRDYGDLAVTLQASTPPDKSGDFQLSAKLNKLDLPHMFRQQHLLYSRTSGNLNFQSQGQGMKDIFKAMQGKSKLTVEIRSDNDWLRTPLAQETLEFSGHSRLLIDQDRIVGVKIEKLDIDSIEQDLTGEVSLASSRNPWLVADLESDRLNISNLMELLPKSDEHANDTALLPSLKKLGAAQISLNVTRLNLLELPFSDVHLELVSGPDAIELKQLDFATPDGSVKSLGKISWKDESATFDSTLELSGIDLDQFLINSKADEHILVSGSAKLQSEGSTLGDMLGNLTGYVDLQATDPKSGADTQSRRKLTMKAQRLPDGMQADISALQWGETELAGSVRYHRTTPPFVEFTLHSGSLSLLPWEMAYLNAEKKDTKKEAGTTSGVESIARASADFVGDILLAPLRFLADGEKAAPSDKLFSSDPLPLAALQNVTMTISGQLDALLSTEVDAKDLRFDGKLADGRLSLQASSGQLGDGKGEISLDLDSTATPPKVKLTSSFEGVRGLTGRDTYPRGGFVSLDSQGQSAAELAANASGLVFLKLGKGPFDYSNSALLTADLTTTVFQTLIPGISRQQPTLECGVTVALLKDGMGVTPYGFVLRTNQANILGRVQVDLIKETLIMSLDSRGRQGVGISVGSIFSNTVQIKGPLSRPRTVPNTTGLLWRGWAAFMTAGLSVIGESAIKRVLAEGNPCNSIERMIGKELCPTNPIAASSEMICPKQ